MAWFRRKEQNLKESEKKDIPSGLWEKCSSCNEILYKIENVICVRTGDRGIDKHGNPKSNFDQGVDIHAKVNLDYGPDYQKCEQVVREVYSGRWDELE